LLFEYENDRGNVQIIGQWNAYYKYNVDFITKMVYANRAFINVAASVHQQIPATLLVLLLVHESIVPVGIFDVH